MARRFEIRREVELPATPEQVWDAVTDGTGGWLWPMEYEPRLGGAAAFGGTVTAWDPPRHFASHVDGEDGWFNDLDQVIEARDGGRALLRYVHSGIFTDDWDSQYDGAGRHTDFYLHTLGVYLGHFAGRRAAYAEVEGPKALAAPGSFAAACGALGLDGAAAGTSARLDLPGTGPVDAVVDYRSEHFLGLRTADGLVRVFGREAWGAPVGVTLHLFAAGADADAAGRAWAAWLEEVAA
jgi:hypothetical protein